MKGRLGWWFDFGWGRIYKSPLRIAATAITCLFLQSLWFDMKVWADPDPQLTPTSYSEICSTLYETLTDGEIEASKGIISSTSEHEDWDLTGCRSSMQLPLFDSLIVDGGEKEALNFLFESNLVLPESVCSSFTSLAMMEDESLIRSAFKVMQDYEFDPNSCAEVGLFPPPSILSALVSFGSKDSLGSYLQMFPKAQFGPGESLDDYRLTLESRGFESFSEELSERDQQ